MLNFLSQVISEAILIILYPFLSIFVNFLPNDRIEDSSKKPTIVIVERWMSINAWHIYWKYYLRRKGFNVHIVNFPFWKGNFDESSKKLDQYLKSRSLKNITIVGISSGALTSLLYLHKYDGWRRANRFVAIGAPFQGTWIASFLVLFKSGWEVLPGSKLIDQIQKYRLLNKDKILCINAKFDEMVPYGSVLKGTHHITIEVVGHNNLHLRVRTTYKLIADFSSRLK